MKSGATFSRCKKYRYRLWRIGDDQRPFVLFIMLNPSTANATENDPTITRCINFAQSWGYGGVYIGNLFAYRTPYPKALQQAKEPIGKRNNFHLKAMRKLCKTIVTAWGNHLPTLDNTSLKGLEKENFHYLALNKTGTPKHPLYLKADLIPIKNGDFNFETFCFQHI